MRVERGRGDEGRILFVYIFGLEKKTPIGFAFLPVLTDKGQHAAGDFDLPVASAEHRYDTGGTNYILPPNYTRARPFGRRHHWQQQ